MSIRRSMARFLSRVRSQARQVRDLHDRLATIEAQFAKYQSKQDALAVPPGSTLFGGDQIRLFRVTADNTEDGTLTAKLQTIDASGTLIDDTVETDDVTIVKPDTSVAAEPASGEEDPVIVAAVFEGLTSDDTPVWVLAGSVAGGASVELFEVVSQTAGVKVVGKMLVGGEVPEGAENVDLLAPFVAWKVEAADTVAGYQLPDGTWRLLSEPPASAAVYQSPQVDSDGLLIFDYPRAHA